MKGKYQEGQKVYLTGARPDLIEEAFIVPKGTMVTFKPGVWHKAQFPINNDHVSVICILPEREYTRDCLVVSLKEEEQFEIVV